jgi:hypothetical protein
VKPIARKRRCRATSNAQPPTVQRFHQHELDYPAEDVSSEDSSVEEANPDQPMRCDWEGCGEVQLSQAKLVAHLEMAHFSKQCEFRCQWRPCDRGGKPFAAQYMLALHMRKQ